MVERAVTIVTIGTAVTTGTTGTAGTVGMTGTAGTVGTTGTAELVCYLYFTLYFSAESDFLTSLQLARYARI